MPLGGQSLLNTPLVLLYKKSDVALFLSVPVFLCCFPPLFFLQPRSSDKKSELLPADWSSNKELYSLRYQAKDGDTRLLLKAIVVDSTLIFNLMVGTADREMCPVWTPPT